MTPAVARAMYRRQLQAHGETITLRRNDDPPVTAEVRARVTGWSAEELAMGVAQGERKALVLAEDVDAEGFPVPIRVGQDQIIVRGAVMTIDVVDDSTRRVGDTLIAYQLGVAG